MLGDLAWHNAVPACFVKITKGFSSQKTFSNIITLLLNERFSVILLPYQRCAEKLENSRAESDKEKRKPISQ